MTKRCTNVQYQTSIKIKNTRISENLSINGKDKNSNIASTSCNKVKDLKNKFLWSEQIESTISKKRINT